MYAEQYIDKVAGLLDEFRGQSEQVMAAAEAVADRLAAGGRMHHFDTGHMKEEPIRRAGGFLALHHLELKFEVEHLLPAGREAERGPMQQRYFYDREELAPLLIEKSHIQSGDVLIQVSNSGKEPFTVGVAVEAKAKGALVIGLTSVAFSEALDPCHSSGKKLYEVADLIIDMGSPFGDAVVDVEGLETPVGATSGVMTAVSLWALMSEIAGSCARRGLSPSIYRSVNLPGGFEHNREMERAYGATGL